MKDAVIHFEHLWENAEKLSHSMYQSTSNEELFDKIRNIMTGINEIEKSNITIDIKAEMKRRFIGEILFLLTAFSSKENVDVYRALHEQLFTNGWMTKQ